LLWQLVFSQFKGRMARQPFWIGIAAIVGLRAAASALASGGGGAAVAVEATDLLLAVMAALIGARLRDFGRSAIWGWVAMGLIEFATIAVMIGTWPREGGAIVISEIPRPALVLNGALLGALVVVVGVIRGDPFANRYGPAPGGGAPPTPARRDDDDEAETVVDIDALIARKLAEREAAAVQAQPPAPAPVTRAQSAPAPAARVFGKRR
jgi:uncharacterized membrane protein YhaH (DUF805 family)